MLFRGFKYDNDISSYFKSKRWTYQSYLKIFVKSNFKNVFAVITSDPSGPIDYSTAFVIKDSRSDNNNEEKSIVFMD